MPNQTAYLSQKQLMDHKVVLVVLLAVTRKQMVWRRGHETASNSIQERTKQAPSGQARH